MNRHPLGLTGTKLEARRAAPRSPANDAAYGKAVLAAVNRANLTALHQSMAKDHRGRTDKQVGAVLRATLAGVDVRGLVKDYRP